MKINFFNAIILLNILTFSSLQVKAEVMRNNFVAIKGGISLGSYETGLNYVLLESFRSKEIGSLVSFSGASAGSINSVLSAFEHCLEPDSKNEVFKSFLDSKKDLRSSAFTKNFMSYTWDIGLEDLLPSYNSGDKIKEFGLFTRKEFLNKKALLKQLYSKANARPDCKFIISMSVTKVEPLEFKILSTNEKIKLQRFVFPLVVESVLVDGQYKLRFFNYDLEPDKTSLNQLNFPKSYLKLPELPKEDDKSVDFQDVWNVAQASSSLPFVFEPTLLNYCYPHLLMKSIEDTEKCLLTRANSDYFSDGGLFDNSPVGIAIDIQQSEKLLSEKPSQKDKTSSEKPIKNRFIYINPDSYRNDSSSNIKVDNSNNHFALLELGGYLSDAFFGTASEREFRIALKRLGERGGEFSKIFKVTNRFHHLMADFDLHFGAFYADEYRRHDYFVGAYDAIHFKSRLICENKKSFTKAKRNLCINDEIAKEIKKIKNYSKTEKDFLLYLFSSEFERPKQKFKDSKNILILLAKSFPTLNKVDNQKLEYPEFLKKFIKIKPKNIHLSQSFKKIIDFGPKYTAEKLRILVTRIKSIQENANSCDDCEAFDGNAEIGTVIDAIEPFLFSYIKKHESGYWPYGYKGFPAFRYGFDISKKDQVFGVALRLPVKLIENITFDIDYSGHYFGSELLKDDYQSLGLALAYQKSSFGLSSIGLGYQYAFEGNKSFDSERNAFFINFGLLNEFMAIRIGYSSDEIEKIKLSKLKDSSFLLTIDLAKVFGMF